MRHLHEGVSMCRGAVLLLLCAAAACGTESTVPQEIGCPSAAVTLCLASPQVVQQASLALDDALGRIIPTLKNRAIADSLPAVIAALASAIRENRVSSARKHASRARELVASAQLAEGRFPSDRADVDALQLNLMPSFALIK